MKSSITDIPGIGEVAAAALAEHGIRTLRKLARSRIETVAAVPGFSTARAGKVIAAAASMIATNEPVATAASETTEEKQPKKDKKKDGKKGKGKGKGKNRDKKKKGKK